MNKILHIVFFVFIGFMLSGHKSSEPYVPSIQTLNSDEVLIMDYEACHWGCTKGKVKFRNGAAILGRHSLELTEQEITDLDEYFTLGEQIEGAPFRCSLPIHISFKTIKGSLVIGQQEERLFPCAFGSSNTIYPQSLVYHLTRRSDETPYWRLSSEERNKRNSLINP